MRAGVTPRRFPPERGCRSGFFDFQSSRTLPRIEASARTINPTTHRLRATVKKCHYQNLLIPRMQTRHTINGRTKRVEQPARAFPPPWSVAEQGASNKRRVWPPGTAATSAIERLRTSAFPKVTTTGLLNQTGSAPSRIIINSERVMSRMMASSQCWGCDAHGCNCGGKNHF